LVPGSHFSGCHFGLGTWVSETGNLRFTSESQSYPLVSNFGSLSPDFREMSHTFQPEVIYHLPEIMLK
jgi:hypothetical protein